MTGVIVADPLLLQTVNSYFSTTVREMTIAITNTAYSGLISGQGGYIGDTEAAILRSDGALVSTDEAQIVHMASLPTGLAYVLKKFDIAGVQEGDVFVNNNPHQGAIHSNDTMLFFPIFHEGSLEYWCAVMAHLSDLGGMAAGGIAVSATSIFAEGLVIPPLKLYRAGVPDETIMELIAANSRQPQETIGDLMALVAGGNVGAERVHALLERYGADSLRSVVDKLFTYSELLTRKNIKKLPNGTYSGSSYVDDDGIDLDRSYTVSVDVTISDDEITVDTSRTSNQARGSINSSYAQSLTAVTYALRCYVGNGVPVNSGMWRPLHINLRHGSLVNPRFPAACNTRMANTTPSLVEAVLWALRGTRPAEVGQIAGGGIPEVHGISAPAGDQEFWMHWEAGWGGGGARDGVDGVDGGGTPMRGGNESGIPVELVEFLYPLRCESFRRCPDSGGPGTFRGGLASEKTFRLLQDCTISARTDRWRFPPAGIDGGLPGSPGGHILNLGTEDEILLPSKFGDLPVSEGQTITFRTVGGGGIGSPMKRDEAAVLDDVRTHRVTASEAARTYGVVVQQEGSRWDIDQQATCLVRGLLQ